MKNLVELRWPVDVAGYEVVTVLVRKRDPSSMNALILGDPEPEEILVPRGGVMESRAPLELAPLLVHEFADTAKTPQALCKFAGQYGLLRKSRARGEMSEELHFEGTPSDEMVYLACGEKLTDWYAKIDLVSDMLSLTSKHPKAVGNVEPNFAKVNIGIGPPAHGEQQPSLRIRPTDLYGAIMTQLALHLHAPLGEQILTCAQCGTLFVAGSGTGKRTTAKYCSQQCTDRANYQRRKAQRVARRKEA